MAECSACLFLNSHHLKSLTLDIFVLGMYNWQTNCSIPANISSLEFSLVPRLVSAFIILSLASQKIFQQVAFPFPAKLPVLSAPVNAWNAGRATFFLRPRVLTTSLRWITLCLWPTPVTNDVSSHNSGYLLRASTKTSVSGEQMCILVAPEAVASIACNNSFVSASSWLLLRWHTSL